MLNGQPILPRPGTARLPGLCCIQCYLGARWMSAWGEVQGDVCWQKSKQPCVGCLAWEAGQDTAQEASTNLTSSWAGSNPITPLHPKRPPHLPPCCPYLYTAWCLTCWHQWLGALNGILAGWCRPLHQCCLFALCHDCLTAILHPLQPPKVQLGLRSDFCFD